MEEYLVEITPKHKQVCLQTILIWLMREREREGWDGKEWENERKKEKVREQRFLPLGVLEVWILRTPLTTNQIFDSSPLPAQSASIAKRSLYLTRLILVRGLLLILERNLFTLQPVCDVLVVSTIVIVIYLYPTNARLSRVVNFCLLIPHPFILLFVQAARHV